MLVCVVVILRKAGYVLGPRYELIEGVSELDVTLGMADLGWGLSLAGPILE